MVYDTIIVGAGAAGCSAAIYATRYNLKTLMLGGPMPGGLITEASDVENYPGFLSITGAELAQRFLDQAVQLGAESKIEIVTDIDKQGDIFNVTTYNSKYQSKSVILAMGTHHRKLGVPGEIELAGRGVSYCATCDAPFFKDKTVVVIGGGNSAIEGAQDISMHAKTVYLVSRSTLKAAPIYIDQLRSRKNIVEISDTNIAKINGESKVISVTLDRPYNNNAELICDGVFVQIGYQPQNELAKKMGIKLSDYGYVVVDAGMGTSLPGVFSAGDINTGSNQLHQQVTSAAEGAIAAQSAYRYAAGMSYLVNA